MTFPIYFNTKKTVNLFGLSENFNFIKNLYLANKLPKVLMLSGKKGSGKSTIAQIIKIILKTKYNLNVVNFSIDDYYKTSEERIKLSKIYSKLFITRGVP